MNDDTIPLAECPARLSWTLADETTYADPPWLTVRLVPSFPECHPAINDGRYRFRSPRPIPFRTASGKLLSAQLRLWISTGCRHRRNGVGRSHPDANTVIWELDVRGPRQLSVFKIAGFTIQ